MRLKCIFVILSASIIFIFTHNIHSQKADYEKNKNKEEDLFGIIPIPFFAYTPETSFIYGVSGMVYFRVSETDRDFRPSTIQPVIAYSFRKQLTLMTNSDFWWNQNKNHIKNIIQYSDFPTRFWGTGNYTKEDDEENYTIKNFRTELEYEYNIIDKLYIGTGYQYSNYQIEDIKPGGLLDTKSYVGGKHGVKSGLGALLSYDTRDNAMSSSEGVYYSLKYYVFDDIFGSEYDFSDLTLDLRNYFSMWYDKKHVFSFRTLFSLVPGNTPFQSLADLGGDNMRGIVQGRFRDKYRAVLETEYRFPLFWRLGLVLFGSVGEVSSSIKQFSTDGIKYSGGLGIRFTIDEKEKIKVRADAGFFGSELQYYLQFLEAF